MGNFQAIGNCAVLVLLIEEISGYLLDFLFKEIRLLLK